jgi:phage terminase large subunit GpA-like protein
MSRLKVDWQPPRGCADVRLMRGTTNKWRPRRRISTIDWFEENIRLPKKVSAFSGFYNRRNFAYQIGIADMFDDTEVKELSLQWATQLGKSTFIQFLISKIACVDPSPVMFVCPDRPTAQEVSKERIMGAAKQIPELREKLLPDARQNAMMPDLGDCLVFMAWSGSPTSMGQRSCRYVFGTEISKWSRDKSEEADAADLVRERVKGFWDHKLIFEGTPTMKGVCRVEELGLKSSQWLEYHVPCPHCNEMQVLDFEHVVFDKGEKGELDRDLAEQTAYYKCEHCKGKIQDRHKLKMLRKGVWAEKDIRIPKGFKGSVFFTPGKAKTRIHTHLESVASPVLTFGAVAGEFVRCMQGDKKKTFQNFTNSWRALTWAPKIKEHKWEDVRIRLVNKEARRGVVPSWAGFLTAGIDIQEGWGVYVVRAWGVGGRSRLVDWGQIISYGEIQQKIFERGFPHEGRGELASVLLTGIDSGYKPYEVYQFVNRINQKYGERMRAIKGQPKGAPYWMSELERSGSDGKVIPGGIQLWSLADPHWKSFLTARYDIPLGSGGAWELPLEADADEMYLRQITSEVQQEIEARNGQKKYEWIVTDTKAGNHYFDAEKIAAAMADMCGWHHLEIKEQPRRVAAQEEEAIDEFEGFLSGAEGFWQ